MNWIAKADPTKEFFIDMITRDIDLDECIFDLLDNSIDGAKRVIEKQQHVGEKKYSGYWVKLTLSKDAFVIEDNCGGIPLEDAVEYAFHFGRKKGSNQTTSNSIGLYGIGMKRAIFKIGDYVLIESATAEKPDEAFKTHINVPEWAAEPLWDFNLEGLKEKGFVGTKISISLLKSSVASEFSSDVFLNNLRKDIAKYYSFILQDGFDVSVNEIPVKPYGFQLRSSSDIAPFSETYIDDKDPSVTVKITAGMAGIPPDDSSNTDLKIKDTEYYGWFVVCNDRVVLAGDKSDRTVWGDAGFQIWHPQYNGFMGIVSFTANDAGALPWTTTKRDVDETNPVYRRAVAKMKTATSEYTSYTNARKNALDTAKQIETAAVLTPVRELLPQITMKLPTLPKAPVVQESTISYSKPKVLIAKVASALGSAKLTNREVGIKTFEYFVENELEE